MGPLNSKDATVRANAIRALGEMVWLMGPEQRQSTGTDRAVEPLIGALAAKDAKSRKCAAVVLKCLGSPRAVEPLTAALRDDPSPEVRAAAAEALGAAKDPRPIGLLTATLENPSEPVEVRVSAAGALGSIADRRAVEPLIRALKDKDPLIRAAALTVADIIPDYRLLRPLLVDALRDPEWRVRDRATRAAGALGKLKDPAAFEVLMTALHDEYPNVRAAATQSLVELKDPRAVPPLAVVLREDDNSYVRWHAAIALEQFEDLRAVGPLTAALKDEDELVRTTARRALEKIKKATQSRQI
jgi:HEAT repeat protein